MELRFPLISNVTIKILPLIQEWQNRPLQNVYAMVFLDAVHFKVKPDGHIVNKAAYDRHQFGRQKGCSGHVDWRERICKVLVERAK
jgi:hypothetical protein